MKSTFWLLFYLRKNEVNKQSNSSIMVRITVNGEKVQFSSKLQINTELWLCLFPYSDNKKGLEYIPVLFYYRILSINEIIQGKHQEALA
jgi:hypothetical protein